MSEEEVKDGATMLEEAGEKAFEAMNADAPKETPEAPGKPAEEPKLSEPAPEPSDKGGDDKLAWLNGLDEKTLNDLKEGKLIPHHRFNEVLEQKKAYEALGTPDEVQKKLADLGKKIEETPKGKIPDLTDEEKETQAFMLKLFPQLKSHSDLVKSVENLTHQLEAQKKAFETIEKAESEARDKVHQETVARAGERVKGYAEELGLDAKNQKILDRLSRQIAAELHADEEAAHKFYTEGDLTVLDKIFQDYKKDFFSGVQRKTEAKILQDKKNQTKLSKPPLPGAPSTPKDKPISEMTLAEVNDRAVEALGL